ncbi:hypothetical protein AOB46_21830 [Chryseobacterium indologenes]|uniref:Uncharacterized protein n=1 Tax=Chryseobacterium indologenes TaxID=253 RepID=A0A0N0ZVM7_CHRID|nr:hypothetical protein AOB46_21830 [Chryseobacterium indologenes]
MAKLFKTRFLTFSGGQFDQDYHGQFGLESTGHFSRIKVVNFAGFYNKLFPIVKFIQKTEH